MTNCLIVGYTSTVLSQVYGLSRGQVRVVLWVVLCLEHSLLLLKLGVAAKIEDVPLWVRKTEEYQKYLQKRKQRHANLNPNPNLT